MKKLVVLTGAGISAESGIPTFRGADGLWEGHRVTDVASPEGWARDPELVLDFYNQRRKKALQVKPNLAHILIAELESCFNTVIVTQNIDDLHEQAGSTKVLHLHGSIFESRSMADPSKIYPIEGSELNLGDTCELGSQLRPNIVWFGEMVPEMENAAVEASNADIFLIVGTSMVVYPAAGLIEYVGREVPKFVVDPSTPDLSSYHNITAFPEKASSGMQKVKDQLVRDFV